MSSAANPCFILPHEREDTRRVIVAAARHLAKERGIEAVTLSAVADELGFALATVYGFFAGKQELLSYLSGDDNDAGDEFVPAGDAPEAQETETPAPAAENIETEDETSEPQDTGPKDGDVYSETLRKQAEELDRLAKRIIVPKSMQREGTDAVLARLETRIHVIEQSLAESEKHKDAETKAMDGRIGMAVDSVQQLQKRMEASDNRNQLAQAELRLEIFNLAQAYKTKHDPFDPVEAAAGPAPAMQLPVWESHGTGTKPPAGDNPQPAFISAARQAAMAAAQQIGEKGGEAIAFNWRILAMGFMVLVLAGASFFFYRTQFGAPAHTHQVVAVAHPAPQTKDRLSALAEAEDANAQLLLGVKLLNGYGTPIDTAKGASLIDRAARHGDPVAQNYLGVLYQTGTGVHANMARAIRWFQVSALQGNRTAMGNLGKVYAGGWREGINYNAAIRWFARAANFGDADAQFNLAVLYERGDGVPQSPSDAYQWYAIAAAQGDREAAKRATIVADRLSPLDLGMAKKIVAEFRPVPIDRAANEMPPAETLRAKNG